MCSPLVPRKGNQEHGTAGARTLLRNKAADQYCLVEKPSTLRLQESAPMGRAWSQDGVQERTCLCAETFGAEICRPTSRRLCDQRSSQGQTHRSIPGPCSRRRAVPLQIKGSHSSGQGQAVHRACPLQSQRGHGQASKPSTRIFACSSPWSDPKILC